MSFARWLLVHSFSIFLVTLFIFGYVYRSELQLENAYQQLLNIEPKTVTTSSPDETTLPQSQSAAKQKTTVNTVNKPDINSSPVSDSSEGKRAKQELTSSVSTLPTVSTLPAVSSDKIESAEKQGEYDRLLLARKAYWDNNYADAIYSYQQLIQENSNNPDYLGELGNIYYSLNDNQNASRLYYQAALVFINQNQPDRARQLVAPVIAMNRELGKKLRLKLQ